MSTTVSGLPIATDILGPELLPVVQNGSSKRATAGQLRQGLAASGQNSDITQIAGLLDPLAINMGGTGSATAAGARSALNVPAIGDFGPGGVSVTETGNLNSLARTEFFNTTAATTNVPVGAGTAAGQGYGIHSQHPNSLYAAQYWTQLSTNRTFVRVKTAGTPLAWDEFAFLKAPTFTTSLAVQGPVLVGQYLLASLPSASGFPGYEIDVTNATGGSKRCRSNGTVWQILNTTTTVS